VRGEFVASTNKQKLKLLRRLIINHDIQEGVDMCVDVFLYASYQTKKNFFFFFVFETKSFRSEMLVKKEKKAFHYGET
jgi:hypothetical protein